MGWMRCSGVVDGVDVSSGCEQCKQWCECRSSAVMRYLAETDGRGEMARARRAERRASFCPPSAPPRSTPPPWFPSSPVLVQPKALLSPPLTLLPLSPQFLTSHLLNRFGCLQPFYARPCVFLPVPSNAFIALIAFMAPSDAPRHSRSLFVERPSPQPLFPSLSLSSFLQFHTELSTPSLSQRFQHEVRPS